MDVLKGFQWNSFSGRAFLGNPGRIPKANLVMANLALQNKHMFLNKVRKPSTRELIYLYTQNDSYDQSQPDKIM